MVGSATVQRYWCCGRWSSSKWKAPPGYQGACRSCGHTHGLFRFVMFLFRDPSVWLNVLRQVGTPQLCVADPRNFSLKALSIPISERVGLRWAEGPQGLVGACLTGSPVEPSQIRVGHFPTLEALLASSADNWTAVKSSVASAIDKGYLSNPRPIEFPTEAGRKAWAIVYSPANKDFVAPEGGVCVVAIPPPPFAKGGGTPMGNSSGPLCLSLCVRALPCLPHLE